MCCTKREEIMNIDNPFLITGYINPACFCDRETETNRIISALENRRNLTLVSIRRLGKTGLIKHIFYQLKDSKYRLLYLDIFATNSLQDLVKVLGNAILQDEKKHSTDYLKKITKLIAGIKARLVFDNITGNPSIELGYSTYQEAEMGIEQIFAYLSSQKHKYIIAIDEFQQITHYSEKQVEAALRTYIQPLTNVSFIFSGSNKHLLTSMFSDYGRPFYQSSDFLLLNRIEKDIYAEFIYQKFSENKRSIDKQEILKLLDYYDTYTFFVQSYFNRLFATGEKKIGADLIEEVKEVILEEREYIFQNYKNLLTEAQFEVLKAVAKENAVTKPNAKDFMKKYGFVQTSSLNRALNALLDKEMVYHEDGAYKVYDVFFAKWLQKWS